MRPIDADELNNTLKAVAMWYTFEEGGKCRGGDDFTRGIKNGVNIALEKVAEQPTINPKKEISEFTEDERNWMDTIVVNSVIAQSGGFQLGYAQAISDFTENIMDYWECSDDKAQKSVLDAIVDLGVELGKRKEVVKKNLDIAKKHGYENNFNWSHKRPDCPFKSSIPVLTRDFSVQDVEDGISAAGEGKK